jgi:hypothetical protein
MYLLDHWTTILKHAWSLRLVILAGLLSGVEVVLPLFTDMFPRGVFSGLSVVAAISAAVARVVAQPKMQAEIGRDRVESKND